MKDLHPAPPSFLKRNWTYGLTGICSLLWFVFWLTAFHPMEQPAALSPSRPAISLDPKTDEPLRTLQNPTFFALPSKEGFSGIFPENHVNISLTLERPKHPKMVLARQPGTAPVPDQTQLIKSVPLPSSQLSVPHQYRTIPMRQPDRIALFFSPNLPPCINSTESLQEIKPLSPSSTHIDLTVRPNGTVAHAFFETPTDQPALRSRVYQLRFSPVPKEIHGWLDIRFTPPPVEKNI